MSAEKLIGKKAYAVLFFAVVALALFAYTYKVVGIAPSYDDGVYAYSLLSPMHLKTTSLFGSAIGFFVYGYPFTRLLGHIMIIPTLMTLSAIALTILIIFLICNEYRNRLAGIIASALYAFNPLVFAYSNRLLPDIFTTMLLALSILLFLKAKKSSKWYLFFISGSVVFAGIFFGYQVLFVSLIYLVFAASSFAFGKMGGVAKSLALSIAGMLIMVTAWLLYQQYLYSTPFFLVTAATRIYSLTGMLAWSMSFYPVMVFPMHIIPSIVGGSYEPYVNVGILGYAFLLVSMFLFTKYGRKYRKHVLPYAIASLAFILFLMYGSQSLTAYSHIYAENRFLMPFVLLASLGSAIAIGSMKARRAIALSATLLVLYAVFFIAMYPSVINFYNSQDALLNYLQSTLPYQNMSAYRIYQNVFSISDAFCYLFDASPPNCTDNSLAAVPSGICEQNKTAIFSNAEICNQSTAFGYPSTYIHIRD